MKIIKIINNNIISSLDSNNNEIVIMGRGIGFGKKIGQQIEESKIEKIFRIEETSDLERFENLLKNIPLEYIQISNDIISYAKETLEMELSHSIYITLTDHISFSINQMKEGTIFSNPLYFEIKRFYPEEYAVGLKGLDLIEERTKIRLPEEEAASIALHLVTAEFNIKVRDSYAITVLLHEMMEIISNEIKIPKEDTLYKDRLVINLKFLSYRLLMLPVENIKKDQELYEFVKKHCEKEYSIVEKINLHTINKYGCQMSEEEIVYMTLNIKRMKDVI